MKTETNSYTKMCSKDLLLNLTGNINLVLAEYLFWYLFSLQSLII